MEMNLNKLSEIERSDWSRAISCVRPHAKKAIVLTVQC